jgi:hypothetical protein
VSAIVISGFAFDEENEEAFARYGLTSDQVLDVLLGPYALSSSGEGHSYASHKVIGRDSQGNCIAVPIARTHQTEIWRPVGAWPCQDHEQAP